IHSMLKADDRKDGTYFGEPLVEFSLGNIKCWLYGRVFEHKPKLSLSDEERQSFGRYKLTLDGIPNDKKVPVPLETVLESSVFIDTLCKDFGRLTFLENESEYDIAAVVERRWS
ncbi:hypothetical protein MX856_004607, partial [Vibrio parahaemolyticus]|nr:hypothetical protein [Vibrio parahaemolyticus]